MSLVTDILVQKRQIGSHACMTFSAKMTMKHGVMTFSAEMEMMHGKVTLSDEMSWCTVSWPIQLECEISMVKWSFQLKCHWCTMYWMFEGKYQCCALRCFIGILAELTMTTACIPQTLQTIITQMSQSNASGQRHTQPWPLGELVQSWPVYYQANTEATSL